MAMAAAVRRHCGRLYGTGDARREKVAEHICRCQGNGRLAAFPLVHTQQLTICRIGPSPPPRRMRIVPGSTCVWKGTSLTPPVAHARRGESGKSLRRWQGKKRVRALWGGWRAACNNETTNVTSRHWVRGIGVGVCVYSISKEWT